MNYSKIGYKIASWAFIIVGLGHLITDLLSSKTEKQMDFIQSMKAFKIDLPGSELIIFSFYQGFSLMMGTLLLSYGLLNLFIVRNAKKSAVGNNIILLNILLSLICTVLSIKYFFIVPIALTSIALFGFSLSLFKRNSTST